MYLLNHTFLAQKSKSMHSYGQAYARGGGGGGGLTRGVTQELKKRWAYPWRGLYAGGL